MDKVIDSYFAGITEKNELRRKLYKLVQKFKYLNTKPPSLWEIVANIIYCTSVPQLKEYTKMPAEIMLDRRIRGECYMVELLNPFIFCDRKLQYTFNKREPNNVRLAWFIARQLIEHSKMNNIVAVYNDKFKTRNTLFISNNNTWVTKNYEAAIRIKQLILNENVKASVLIHKGSDYESFGDRVYIKQGNAYIGNSFAKYSSTATNEEKLVLSNISFEKHGFSFMTPVEFNKLKKQNEFQGNNISLFFEN